MTNTNESPLTFQPRLLITAGPTREPIDSVRYIGNRSSGTLGLALAHAAADLGWPVTLLLGPTERRPDARVACHDFQTTADLQRLLQRHLPDCDILVMAAAVADFTPENPRPGKLPRHGSSELVIRLMPTPDLLAEAAGQARPDQLLVGFALEPADSLAQSALGKLARKRVDLIIANPLETMESPHIHAQLFGTGAMQAELAQPAETMTKPEFAWWLLPTLRSALDLKRAGTNNS
jgi:phosphopantothenoylcysteine decarboxylase/phosphopantothenate--cysteine ligase